MPVFSPKDGKIDTDRLRLVLDEDAKKDADLANKVGLGIRAWESRLGIAIINLDLNPNRKPDTTDYQIIIGNGASAREPEKTLKRSYVSPTGGYFFQTLSNPAVFAHEFGHLLGLADRYYEGYTYKSDIIDKEKEGYNVTVPMAKSLFGDPQETYYDPKTNLMSSTPQDWTISSRQRQLILAGSEEPQLSRNVIGIFQSNATAKNYKQPSSMYLSGDQLYTDNPTPQAIRGYTLEGAKKVFAAKAAKVPGGNSDVKTLWRKLKPQKFLGKIPVNIVRDGKRYRGPRVRPDGPRIHQAMMELIAQLAGG